MGKIWTQQDIDLLEEYYKQDLPRKEIAKKLGRSECAIVNKAQKLGINDKYISKLGVVCCFIIGKRKGIIYTTL